jgi:alkyl hydroperoxide reductase subunit F
MNNYDLVIIGGGPAGVAAGVYAARKKINSAIVADTFGGQSTVSADIQNWVGVPSISGFDFAQSLEKHLRSQEGIEIISAAAAEKIEEFGENFKIVLRDGRELSTRTIFLATGAKRRKLNIPGEKELDGKGVAYCSICDAPLFQNQAVAVVGGGNAGLEAVLDLVPYASEIYLLHRHPELKGDKVTQDKIREVNKLKLVLSAEPLEILGDKLVTGLRYKDLVSGLVKDLKVSGVFVEIGHLPASDLVKNLVDLNIHGQVKVDPLTQRTSHPQIWAAGDVTDGKYQQNNISMGDAVKAVLNIQEYLRGKE